MQTYTELVGDEAVRKGVKRITDHYSRIFRDTYGMLKFWG